MIKQREHLKSVLSLTLLVLALLAVAAVVYVMVFA